MRIMSLEAYGAHAGLLAAWEGEYGSDLLPIQEKAVREGRVLQGQSVIGSGPTGCGKTFIAEMAATHAATQGRRAVYLVPTKALAEAKYRQFSSTYGPLGLRVIISTQDRRASDYSFARGDFDLALTVPEKLWSVVLSSPALARSVGALVVDELQLVGDPHRGPCLELLLSHLAGLGAAQIVGLSAVLSNGRELAGWLHAELVEERERPVELRKGVWREGRFVYREHNTRQAGEEALPAPCEEEDSPLEALVSVAVALAAQEEPTLAFLRDRASTVRAAMKAGERLSAPPAEEALAALADLPRTFTTEALASLLARGVAFHNADLHFSERQVVEQAVVAGEVKCLFTTSTLAVGVNLPARNVLIDPVKWDTGPGGAPCLSPLSQADYENMAGRAGRLGFGDAFGRAILLGGAEFDSDLLLRRFAEAPPEPVVGQLGRLPALQRELLSAALRPGDGPGSPAAVTLSQLEAGAADLPADLRALAETLLQRPAGEEGAVLTGLGRAAVASGLSLSTVLSTVAALRQLAAPPNNLEAVILASLSAEARAVPVTGRGRERQWMGLLEAGARERGDWTEAARGLLWAGPLAAAEREAAAHVACLALEWTGSRPSDELEERTGLHAGRALALCEAVGWAVQCLARFCEELAAPATDVGRLQSLGESLSAALPEPCLPLARALSPTLQRDHLLALAAAGISSPLELLNAPASRLQGLVPPKVLAEARRVCASRAAGAARPSQTPQAEPEPEAPPVLSLNSERSDVVMLGGQEVAVTDKEFRLLRILARRPGRCVPYDDMYKELWGMGTLVEVAQIGWHRHGLEKKLMRALPQGAARLIKTIKGQGLLLDLKAEQVAAA